MSKPSDLVQGTLDLLLLKILALEPLHGWAIGQRLKQEGWITAEWKPTENNRRAKFYSLSRLGRKQLQKEAANWERLSGAITGVLRLEEA
jgi:DNA-binding PadR family transcriptional regulator